MNQKGLAHIILILILLVGIVAGVFLVGKTQIFKPKASAKNIVFSGDCVGSNKSQANTTCPKVTIKFTSPIDTTAVSDNSFNFNLVKVAFAAGSGKNYYCKTGDPNIYHTEKICNPVLGFICFTW